MSKYTSGKTTQKRDKCIQRKSSEISALKAEIDALKAQNADLLAAQQWRDIESAPKDGTDFLVDYEFVTIARWQPDGSQHPWIFLDTDDGKFIFNRFREKVEGLVWRHKPLGWEAIEKARGDLWPPTLNSTSTKTTVTRMMNVGMIKIRPHTL